MSYAATAVQGLEACPFCREHFPRGEASECPLCGVALIAAAKLPTAAPTDEDGVPVSPEDEVMPWGYWGRARGPLIVLCVLGLVAFCLPWVHTFTPDRRVFTGIDIARRTGLTWAAGVAWFTLLPVLMSRRTIRTMLGARLVVAMLGAVPAICTLVLLMNPPSSAEARGVTVHLRYTWDPAIYATLVLGLVTAAVGALRFGGRPDDIKVTKGSSANHTLH